MSFRMLLSNEHGAAFRLLERRNPYLVPLSLVLCVAPCSHSDPFYVLFWLRPF